MTEEIQKTKSNNAFRTISEAAEELNVPQHVLRFWETKFTQIKPMKRGGGRRFYRPEDVLLLKKIHTLLYVEGYTIKGVQKLIKGVPKSQVVADKVKPQSVQVFGEDLPQVQVEASTPPTQQDDIKTQLELRDEALRMILNELLEMREQLRLVMNEQNNANVA